MVEVNHFYDGDGRPVFDQLIFYDWDADASRFQVRAWRLIKSPSQWPVRVFTPSPLYSGERAGVRGSARGEYSCLFRDGELLRHVRAASFRETWTQHDPELLAREYLSPQDRREFTRPKPPNPASGGWPPP